MTNIVNEVRPNIAAGVAVQHHVITAVRPNVANSDVHARHDVDARHKVDVHHEDDVGVSIAPRGSQKGPTTSDPPTNHVGHPIHDRASGGNRAPRPTDDSRGHRSHGPPV